MNRLAAFSATSLAMTVLVSGCAGERFTVLEEDGVVAVVNNDTSSGMDAQVPGAAVINDGCWSMLVDEGGIMPVAWPMGTTIQDGDLVIPGVEDPVKDGEEVLLGGGEVPASGLPASDQPCWTKDSVVIILNG